MNSYQLVIRCDTTSGFYKVGWTSELPLGRFEHFELLIETENLTDLNPENPSYSIYIAACNRVSMLNSALIVKEREHNQSLGWRNVLLSLNDITVQILPDKFGCYSNLATKTRYRLSKNSRDVWAVIKDNEVLHIVTRYPFDKLPELKYQIWKYNQLDKLNQFGADVCQGRLVVCSSGLWFVESDST